MFWDVLRCFESLMLLFILLRLVYIWNVLRRFEMFWDSQVLLTMIYIFEIFWDVFIHIVEQFCDDLRYFETFWDSQVLLILVYTWHILRCFEMSWDVLRLSGYYILRLIYCWDVLRHLKTSETQIANPVVYSILSGMMKLYLTINPPWNCRMMI